MGLVIAALLSCACSNSAARLLTTHDSPESLARGVLAAIEDRNIEALHALALGRKEFTDLVWPELPAARPERNLSPGFIWGTLNQKSNLALRHTLAAHGGKRLRLVGVRFLGRKTRYDCYVVYRESELTVTDETGIERTIRVFGSIVEQGGRFKVFSYVIDD